MNNEVDENAAAVPAQEPDAHDCRQNDDGLGYCDICGALIYGTSAYYDACGCDPPETLEWPEDYRYDDY